MVIAERVAARFKAQLKTADVPKPKSVYDKIPEAHRPFGWATPAPLMGGEVPMPWRVAHADRAEDLLKKMFPQFRDIYVTYDDELRGRLTLWIGLRDNRDRAAHAARLEEMAAGLQKASLKVLLKTGTPYSRLYLVDDLPKDVLRR